MRACSFLSAFPEEVAGQVYLPWGVEGVGSDTGKMAESGPQLPLLGVTCRRHWAFAELCGHLAVGLRGKQCILAPFPYCSTGLEQKTAPGEIKVSGLFLNKQSVG